MTSDLLARVVEAYYDITLHVPLHVFGVGFTVFGFILAWGIATETVLRRRLLTIGSIGLVAGVWWLLWMQAETPTTNVRLDVFVFFYGALVVPVAAVAVGVGWRFYAPGYANTLAVLAMSDGMLAKERERRNDNESDQFATMYGARLDDTDDEH